MIDISKEYTTAELERFFGLLIDDVIHMSGGGTDDLGRWFMTEVDGQVYSINETAPDIWWIEQEQIMQV